MAKYEVTEKNFLEDVRNHGMIVRRDDGVYRHISFSAPDTSNQAFELVTWPGVLCYHGDMGTYVFTRIRDMFQFFRKRENTLIRDGESLHINPHYWGEKLVATDRSDGTKTYDPDLARKRVMEYVEEYIEGKTEKYKPEPLLANEDDDDCDRDHYEEELRAYKEIVTKYDDLKEDIKDLLDCHADSGFDVLCHHLHDYHSDDHKDFYFDHEFFNFHSYSIRFMWALYAIAYGVTKYDQYKTLEAEQLKISAIFVPEYD